MNNKIVITGSIIISISLIICSFILKGSHLLESYIPAIPQSSISIPGNFNITESDVMKSYEAAIYLGINEEVLQHAIEKNELPDIPYMKLGGNYVFSKKQLDIWVQDAVKNKRNFIISYSQPQSYEIEKK